MDLPDLKKLESLLKLCRRQGVTEIKVDCLEFKLGEMSMPAGPRPQEAEPDPTNPYSNFPTGDLTPEQLMFYSAGGMPEDDPELKKQ